MFTALSPIDVTITLGAGSASNRLSDAANSLSTFKPTSIESAYEIPTTMSIRLLPLRVKFLILPPHTLPLGDAI